MEFESIRDIEAKREAVKEARNQILEKAKSKYEREEKKRAEAVARGEDKWMLPSLSEKIDKHTQELKEKKLKLKKEKKERREKKKKDKKKKRSKHDTDSADEWVEVTKTARPAEQTGHQESAEDVHMEPKENESGNLKRDDWMMMDADLPTVSRDDLREKIRQDKAHYASLSKHIEPVLDEPGQHANELNPYWKSGSGTGLPGEKKEEGSSTKPKFSLRYLKQSYDRMEKQSEETGESMEDLAKERFGSREDLEMMIMDAERAEELKRDEEREKQPSTQNRRFLRPEESEQTTRRHRNRSRDRVSERRRSRSRSKEKLNSTRDRKRSRSRSRERRHRSRSRSRERRHRSRSRSRERRNKSRSKSRDRRNRSRSKSRDRRNRSRSKSRDRRNRSRSPVKKRTFMKPGEMREQNQREESKTSSRPNWKKPGTDDRQARGPVKPEERVQKPALEYQTVRRSPSPDSSSTDSSSEEEEPTQQPMKILTDAEMNSLGAKILRAEMMGNTEAAERLKSELESARETRKNAASQPQPTELKNKKQVLVLTRTDRHGNSIPLTQSELRTSNKNKSRREKRKDKKPVNTRDERGEITKYFNDDDRFSISDMVRSEKLTTAADQQKLFSNLASKVSEKTNDDDRTLDDVMTEKAASKNINTSGHDAERMTALAVRSEKMLDKCRECLHKTDKHLIISMSNKTYLRLPTERSLCDGHCQIVPIHHTTSSTNCDEEVFSEIRRYVRSLVEMFSHDKEQGLIVLETCMKLHKQPHMVVECIPVPREIDDMAPIYFKKAIQECESEWAQNKKLVTLTKDKNIRQSIPRGFPFFAVDFGLDPGFAHVIEDEHSFPHYFGKEVVGGMLDLEPRLWRKPQKTSFDEQRLKVLNFSKQYKQYDWTITKPELTNQEKGPYESTNQEADSEKPPDQESSSSE